MSNTTHEELNLRSALLGTGLVQPVDSSVTRSGKTTTMEVLCRQVPGQEAQWLRQVDALLARFEDGKMSLHLCRRYLRKNGQMVFGWHLGVSGSMSEVRAGVRAVIEVLAGARPTLDGAPRQAPSPGRPASQRAAPEEEAPLEDPGPGRAPGPPAAVVPQKPGTFRLRTISRDVDQETGAPFIVEEMQLPHVTKEMNRPTAGGRGATFTAGSERPRGRR